MKSRLLMYLSLIILAIGLAGIYITQSTGPSTDESITQSEAQEQKEKTIKIWRTKDALEQGRKVSRDDFRIDQVLESEAFEMGIQDNIDLKFPDILVIKIPLEKNSPVLPEYFITPEEDGYFRYVLEDGFLPVPISLRANAVVGDVIQADSVVDILALTSTTQNLAGNTQIRDLANVSFTTILSGVKVLQVLKHPDPEEGVDSKDSKLAIVSNNNVSMILQLTKDQAAKVNMAQGVAQLEIMISSEDERSKHVDIDMGDIISGFKTVRELRVK